MICHHRTGWRVSRRVHPIPSAGSLPVHLGSQLLFFAPRTDTSRVNSHRYQPTASQSNGTLPDARRAKPW